MPKPLQFGDPGELGPFRLESRLHESAAGIVYLGADPQGRTVEVALLTTAAAGDAAARDRFRAAVAAEAPRVSAFPRRPPVAGPGDPAPVVAALSDGDAPWVATVHQDGHPGAERFLRPVLLERGWGLGGRRRGGPNFQQYWVSGPRGPALHTPEPPATAPAPTAGDTKGLAAAVVSLAALLVLLAFLVLLLFSCEPSDPVPRPTDVPTTVPAVPPPPLEPSTPSTPRPTPSHKSKTPQPSPSGPGDTINPARRPGPVVVLP
jgi:hypothetical protein